MIGNGLNDVSQFESLVFDRLSTVESAGGKIFHLKKLGCRQNHTHAVVEIVEPLSKG